MTPDGKFCGPCYRCKCDMWLPSSLYDAAKRTDKITFFCPYGHPQVFTEGESEETKLRRERDRLFQRTAQLDDMLRAKQLELDASHKEAKALVAKARVQKKRSAAGTCPCCKRTFRQMALHMKNQHPEFLATEVH